MELRKLSIAAFFAIGTGLSNAGTVSAADAEFTLRLPNVDPPYTTVGDLKYPNHVFGMMRTFKDSLEGLSGGRIAVELYPNGTLGDLRENVEAVQAGVLEGATPNEGVMSGFYPEIQIVTIPYVFSNPVVAWEVLDGPWGQKLFDGMISKGIRTVAIGENAGFRIWANNEREIRTPADMTGLKIRTMEIPAHQAMVSSLGASPTAIPWLEVYGALQTGVVDGAELPIIGALQQNLHEVFKYVTIDQHVYSLALIVISEKWFQTLPDDLKQAVIIAGKQAQVAGRGLSQSLINDVVDEFRKKDVQVTVASPEEQAVFRETAQPGVIAWMVEQFDQEYVDEFLNAVQTVESELKQ